MDLLLREALNLIDDMLDDTGPGPQQPIHCRTRLRQLRNLVEELARRDRVLRRL